MTDDAPALTPELLLSAYASGIFPMADDAASDALFWLDPEARGIFEMDGFHVSRSLRRRALAGGFTASFNRDFEGVMRGCADRDSTWINGEIFDLCCALHRAGHAHSQEIWDANGALIGGVYGVSLGGAFFGESMFSRATDGSKLALLWLIDRLRAAGFTLFDTQFLTDHLASLGAIEIPRADYRARLAKSLKLNANPESPDLDQSPDAVIQRMTHTS